MLLWNERRTDSTPFLREYEQLLLSYGTDYQNVRHERTTAGDRDIFRALAISGSHFRLSAGNSTIRRWKDGCCLLPTLRKRTMRRTSPCCSELRRIFDAHQVDGRVAFEYDTRVYFGQLV